jgi:hypothetical protein
MTEKAYLSVLLSEPKAFRRTSDSNQSILAFNDDFVHLYLDDSGSVTKISVFRPRKVSFVGVQLLNRPLEEVGIDLVNAGQHFVEVDVGLWNEQDKILLVEVDGMVDGVEFG